MNKNILILSDTNWRNQSAPKRYNDALEYQNIILNGVNLITTGEIHHIFVRLRNLNNSCVETEAERLFLNKEGEEELEAHENS